MYSPYAVGSSLAKLCSSAASGILDEPMPQERNHSFQADAALRSLKVFSFFAFAIMGIWVPYLALYYRDLGLSGQEIGLLIAIYPMSVLFLPPLWGYISDRASDPRRVLAVCIGVSGVALLPCASGGTFWFFVPFFLLFSLFNCPMIALNDGLIFSGITAYGGDYGRIRFWGSLGFVFIVVTISGVFLLTSKIRVIFLVWCVVIPVAFRTLWRVPRLPSRLRQGQYLQGLKLLRSWQFVVFIIGVMLNRVTMTSLHVFLSIYLRELNLPLFSIGLIWAVGPLSELVFFHYGDRLTRLLGVKWLLVVSLAATVVRLGVLSLGPPVWVILLSQLLHSLTFAANHMGAVTYVNAALPPQLRASGQTILTAIAIGMAGVVGASATGYFFDRVGIFFTYRMGAAVAAVGAAFLVVAFRRKEKISIEVA